MTKLILAFAICVGFATAAFAQTNIDLGGVQADTSAPVEVTADSLNVDQDTGIAIFDGNVLIGQGALRLAADKVEVIYAEETGDIQRLVAAGNVTFVTSTDAAEAQSAIYDLTTGTVTLSGSVLLTQGASALSAESMVINLNSGNALLTGRVRTVLQQGNN